MRQPLRNIEKDFFRNLLRRATLFLPIFFLAFFLTPQIVKAQGAGSTTVGFDQFKCLFEKTNSNGSCNPQPQPVDIKTGAASGILYGKTDPSGLTTTGIKSIVMQLGLWIDIDIAKKESDKYFYNRVADDNLETFVIRLSFTDPATSTPVYKLFKVPYLKKSISVSSPGSIQTISVQTNTGIQQQGIAFYKTNPNGNGDEVIKQQVILATTNLGTELGFGADITADFWYCGGLKDNNISSGVDGRYAPRENGRVEYFTSDGTSREINGTKKNDNGYKYEKTLCDGTAYYKIGKSETFKLPATAAIAEVDSQQELTSGIVASEYIGSVLPLCSITPFGNGSVMGCIAQILYGGVFRPVAFFAQLMGQLFDFFLGYSLSDESYRHEFVQTGWQLVRDISNIFFIIIMTYSGLMAVFNTSSVSYKKVIPTLIINALIINFSLFATRIIIDMSNITARIFYNQMVVKVDGQEQKSENSSTGYKPISEAIVSSFNPQNILKNSVLQGEGGEDDKSDEKDTADFNSQSSAVPNSNGGFKRYQKEYASYFALVTLVSIAIMFAVAMMFWKTAFMFVGRVVGLYVAMIFSPFAFLSRGDVPLVGKIPTLNHSAWWNDLVNYSLLAPIFVFFLYIINAFLNVEFFTKVGLDQNGQGFFGSVMYVVIPMLIIYGLISQGVAVAKRFAGKYGEMAQSIMSKGAGKVIGGASGAVLALGSGGLAYAGTRYGSRLGKSIGNTQLGKWAATSNNPLARMTKSVLNASQTSSWDVRKTKLGQLAQSNPILSGMGVKIPNNVSGFGQKYFEGGFKDMQKREQDKIKKRLLERKKVEYLSDDEAKKLWEKTLRDRADKAAEDKYFESTTPKFKESKENITRQEQIVKDNQKQIKDLTEQLEKGLLTKEKASEAKETISRLGNSNGKLEKDIKEEKQKLIDFKAGAFIESKGKYKDTQEYKDVLKTYQEEEEKKAKKKYGKIENVKDLQKALAVDYAEELRNNSFWMKDGKQKVFWTDDGVPFLLGGERLKFEQEALDAATKSFIKDYGKTKGGTSKIDQYKEKLESINDKIKETIASILNKSKDDIDLSKIDIKDQENHIKSRIETLRAEMDLQSEKYKKVADAYRKGGGDAPTEEDVKIASKAKREAEDQHNEYKDLWKTKSDTENNLSKEEDKNKPKDDKSKDDKK